jgi:cell division protein FtsB
MWFLAPSLHSADRILVLVSTQEAQIASLEARLSAALPPGSTSPGTNPAPIFTASSLAANREVEEKLRQATTQHQTLRSKNIQLQSEVEQLKAEVELLMNDQKVAGTSSRPGRPSVAIFGQTSTSMISGPSPLLSPAAVADLASASELSDVFSSGSRQPSA